MNFTEKLTEAQITELKEQIKKSKDAKAVRRAQAIILVNEKAKAHIIQAISGFKRAVAVKLRKKFIKQGFKSLLSKRKKAPKCILTRNQKKEIVKILNHQKPSDFGFTEYGFWTTTVLAHLIKEQYGVQYKSKTSLYLIFKQAKFTFRKPEKISEKRNEEQIAAWKEKYGPIIKEECARPDTIVLCGDEVVLTSATRLQRAWLPTNQPAYVEDTTKRKSVHLYGFLNIQSGEAVAFKTKQQTGEVTVEVLKKLAKLNPGKRIALFWDNASWHKSQKVKDYLATTDCFMLYNFPPYAPDLNPQEHIWKEVREKVLNNRLIKNIDKAADNATSFIKNSIFQYKFFGAHGTFGV